MSNPYIIITLGATGSGKSTLINETISYLKLEENYVKILVDDLVENNKLFKEKISSIILDILEQCKKERRFCLDEECKECNTSNYYEEPSEELLKKFNDAYFTVRKTPNCVNDSILNCDKYNDEKLRKAIEERKNIILETTGLNIPNWLLSEPFINENTDYTVIFAYSLVNFDKLIERNKKRVIKSIKEFQNNKTKKKPAPRLPDIKPETFRKTVNEIRKTLLKLFNNCIKSHIQDICGSKNIDQLLIFDNNETEMKLVFDSNNSSENNKSELAFTFMINKLFNLQIPIKGGRKLSNHRKLSKKTNKKTKKIINKHKLSKKNRYN
jgi:polyhydroxyalkanoate synthesis regulator phasin